MFILDEHPWHAIDVFVRLPECRFNSPFFFFRLFLFVFILDKHSWHAIDVFVRLLECRFNSAIILQPKKLFYFTLVYLEIS